MNAELRGKLLVFSLAGAAVATPAQTQTAPHTVTIKASTILSVRLNETLSTSRNFRGDAFIGSLDQPLVIDGFIIADQGARVEGRVVELVRAGKQRHLALDLTRLYATDGQKVAIQTEHFQGRVGAPHTGRALVLPAETLIPFRVQQDTVLTEHR